jgi:long-chain acyl-CoA synthetase
MPINTLFKRHALYRPDQLALIFEQHRLTHRDFNARVNRLCHALTGLGLERGDKIAMILNNSLEMLDLYAAVSKTGLVIVPLSPLLRGNGLANLLNDSDSVAVFTMQSMVKHLDPIRAELFNVPADRYFLIDADTLPNGYHAYTELVANQPTAEPLTLPIRGEDPYNIIYSSGTTGMPKGIIHTHAIREAYCTGFTASYRMHPESVILHSGSLVFNGAFLTFMPWFYLGCTYILHPYFDAQKMIDTIPAEGVTHIMLVPSQIIQLMQHDTFNAQDMPSLEMICTVGAPLHLEHKQELIRRFPNQLYELYGLTEGFVTILDRDDYPNKTGSVGVPPPLYEMRIVSEDGQDLPPREIGEIVGYGPITMPGYYKRPDLTQNALRDGWLHSGDLGYVDEDGFLYLVDRKKDMIISGGVNVYPRDIEEVAVQHPAVVEAAVFGVPDDKWGETPVAAVVLKAGEDIAPETLVAWINARLEARYQKVSAVKILDTFPRSVAGKTLRRILRRDYDAG